MRQAFFYSFHCGYEMNPTGTPLKILTTILLFLVSACERSPEQQSQGDVRQVADMSNDSVADAAPLKPAKKSPSDEDVLVSSNHSELTLTLGDFDQAVRRTILFAPDDVLEKGVRGVGPAQLKKPMFQQTILKSMVETRLVELEAKARQIDASLTEVTAQILDHERLRRFAPETVDANLLPPELAQNKDTFNISLKELGLEPLDVYQVARDMVLRKKLEQALPDEVSRQQVQDAYIQAHDRAKILWVRFFNVPQSSEIDAFLKEPENQKKIRTFFEQNPRRFRAPAHMLADLLMAPPTLPQHEAVRVLKDAALQLKEGKTLEQVAAQNKLEVHTEQTVIMKEDSALFRAKPGEQGVSVGAPRGNYLWIAREKFGERPLELTRSIKREIAAELMRQTQSVSSVNAAVKQAKTLLESSKTTVSADALMRKIKAELPRDVRVKVSESPWIERHPEGFIISVGTSPELLEQVFKLKDKGDVMSKGVGVDQYIWIGKLVDREHPDMEKFSKSYATYREQFLTSLEGRILDLNFSLWQKKYDIKANRLPLLERYGREKKR